MSSYLSTWSPDTFYVISLLFPDEQMPVPSLAGVREATRLLVVRLPV